MSDHANEKTDRIEVARRYCEFIPHVRALGMEMIEAFSQPESGGVAVMSLPWSEKLIGDPLRGRVHTGVLTTLVDSAAGFAVLCAMEGQLRPIATLDLRLDYLRAGAGRQPILARAECYRLTSNVAFVRADVEQDGVTIAQAVATFMVGTTRKVAE